MEVATNNYTQQSDVIHFSLKLRQEVLQISPERLVTLLTEVHELQCIEGKLCCIAVLRTPQSFAFSDPIFALLPSRI